MVRKKYKIEKSLLKMYGDTPEGRALRRKIQDREDRKAELRNKMIDYLEGCGIFVGIILVAATVLAAIICPASYYGSGYVDVTVSNLSDADYTYILTGSDEMRAWYYCEERNLDNSSIIFTMSTCHTFSHKEAILKFLEAGNISSKIIWEE